MSSILTNPASLMAMLDLTSTQKSLVKYQSQAATGLKVESAADNAAYWAIGAQMNSQLGALRAVSESIAQSQAIMDVTNTALTSIIKATQSIKADLVSALQPGNDLTSIQNDIAAQQNEIVSIANSATFDGQNWLVDNWQVNNTETITTNYSDTQANISAKENWNGSYSVTSDEVDTNQATDDWGNVISGQNEITTGNTYTFATVTTMGVSHDVETTSNVPAVVTSSGNNSIVEASIADMPINYSSNNGVSFYSLSKSDLKLFDNYNGTNTSTTTINYADNSTTTQDTTDTETSSYNNSVGLTYDTSLPDDGTGLFTQSFNTTVPSSPAYTLPSSENLLTLNIAGLSNTDLQSALGLAESMTNQITSAASQLGAGTGELNTQQTLLTSTMNSLSSGIASLVDADMDIVSSRLSALQVQQQLGIQSLAIANSNSTSILKLFE